MIIPLNTLYLIVNIAIALCTILGGYVAFRAGMNKQASEIQERVIVALQAELNALRSKVEQLEQDNAKLVQTINTIKVAMRKRGFLITIDGEMVSIHDQGGTTQTARIHGSHDKT